MRSFNALPFKSTAIALCALSLVACSVAKDGEGTEITINNDEDGKKTSISIGGDGGEKADGKGGKFSIKTEGFSMDIDIPAIQIDAEDFDLNDVSLYPGTKITSFDIDGKKQKNGSDGKVTMGFAAPASPSKVLDWFEEKMGEEDFVISRSDNGITGKTDDGDDFELTVEEAGAHKTKGELSFASE